MAADGRALHGIHRDCGARAPGGRRLRAGLSVSLHIRCRRKALGLQGSMQLGCGPQALARAGAAQRRDGRALPGELRQVPGARVTLAAVTTPSLESRLWSALAEINDPEMPVNLVDLGLIYGLTVPDSRGCVRLTFTAMGCPASDMIMGAIRERLLAEPGIEDVRLDVVWDPPWTSARDRKSTRLNSSHSQISYAV